jgi:hypothetical protein
MPYSARMTPVALLQNAQTAASAGETFDISPCAEITIEVSGTFTNLTANFEGSLDGVTWSPLVVRNLSTETTGSPNTTATGLYHMGYGSGIAYFRVPITAQGTPTGAITVRAIGRIG